jgi:hypothetical protein
MAAGSLTGWALARTCPLARRGGVTPIDPVGFRLHLFPEQLQFLTQFVGGILGEHRQAGDGIEQAAANAGTETLQGGLDQGGRRAHQSLDAA